MSELPLNRDPAKAPLVDAIAGATLDMAQSNLLLRALTDPDENSEAAKAQARAQAENLGRAVQDIQTRASAQSADLAARRAALEAKKAGLAEMKRRAGR